MRGHGRSPALECSALASASAAAPRKCRHWEAGLGHPGMEPEVSSWLRSSMWAGAREDSSLCTVYLHLKSAGKSAAYMQTFSNSHKAPPPVTAMHPTQPRPLRVLVNSATFIKATLKILILCFPFHRCIWKTKHDTLPFRAVTPFPDNAIPTPVSLLDANV